MQYDSGNEDYQDIIDKGQRPSVRGFTLSAEDRLRQWVINQLICHFQLDFGKLEQRLGVDARTKFADELRQLEPMIEHGLLNLSEHGIQVYNSGRLLIRDRKSVV